MRHAFAQEAEQRRIVYGIEVPTRRKYRFTKEAGSTRRSALHDLVLFDGLDSEPGILVELKEAQVAISTDDDENITDAAAISKDFQKLFGEKAVHGKCLFHILQAADSGTVPALLTKYIPAIRVAHTTAAEFDGFDTTDHTWFCFAILILRDRLSTPANQPQLMTYCCQTNEVTQRYDVIRQPEMWTPTYFTT
ncbi:MAG: hypothetical protein K8U57_34725 [Planctomycetes bacterium]|nr:hypothetical protein [Planctomycetota bacterium]